MDASEQGPASSPSPNPEASFVPNGRAPRGQFKTWKRDKSEKPAGTFKERRAARVAAHQAAVASKSKLKEDGERWVDAHQQFTTGEEAIVDDADAKTETTWEDISYDEVREASARQMLESDRNSIAPEQREQFQVQTSAQWDAFYRVNKQNFFKDRNYLGRTFKDLEVTEEQTKEVAAENDGKQILMEVGSGVGNTLFPLVETHKNKRFYAFDCSPKAIELLRSHEKYDPERVRAFVCDITREPIPDSEVEDGSVDFVTMIFMLSALAPEQMDDVLQKINKKMKMGGSVLFRDYGVYDMTQMRFYAKKTPNKLGENFYRRTDGTFTYFFSLEFLAELFTRNGFEVASNTFDTRVLSNRKRKIRMYRVWAQSKFVKVADATASSAPNASSSTDVSSN